MRRHLILVIALALTLCGLASHIPSSVASVGNRVEITGAGVSVYPTYAEGVDRYGIRTTAATAGQIQVRVDSGASDTVIRVNGVPTASGATRTIDGLTAGDEINVQIASGGSVLNQSWIYLPDGFPQIDTATYLDGPEPGWAAMTLKAPGGDSYPTLVNTRGVPSYVGRRDTITSDLNLQPNGHYSLAVAVTVDLWGDYVIEEYDQQFRKVGSYRMLGHPKTDFHDTILLPDGGRILMAYIKAADGQTDSWLQEVAPDGRVLLSWNSRDHVDRGPDGDVIENALGDYAHLNSMQVMGDGNLLLSFRHLNTVMKIDRLTGDVLWRLGGKRSDFDFGDDPLGGPCAQHTARELANGDIQIFDNGSATGPTPSNPLCPDPANPDGSPVYRPSSRVTVYHLDAPAHQAHLVRSNEVGAFGQFAGSAQRLGANTIDDHVFVGLNSAEQIEPPKYGTGEAPDAVELDADGEPVWTLTAPGFATYRATKVPASDQVAPQVTITSPIDGASVQQGDDLKAAFGCTDTGGSNLDGCSANASYGAPLSGEPGTHQLVVRASDRSGNTTTRAVTYTVVTNPLAIPTPPTAVPIPTEPTAPMADVSIKKRGGHWKGDGTIRRTGQAITLRTTSPGRAVAHVRVRNIGQTAGRLTLTGYGSNAWSSVRWFAGRKDVTSRVRAGTYRTTSLDAGDAVRLRLVVRIHRTDLPRMRTLRLVADNNAGGGRDVVRARLVVR